MRTPPSSDIPWPTVEAVAEQVRACTLCGLADERTTAVPGEGSAASGFMFIGEGPGFHEDVQGRPFVGRAGALLDELLAGVPLRREDVFITNVVKCRPPDNRDPQAAEVAACWPYLEAQIALVRPRVIVPLGRHSLVRFFPDARISGDHGRILNWREYVVCPLYHPAAALRSQNVRATLEADMRRLPQAMIAALGQAAAPVAEARPAHGPRREQGSSEPPSPSRGDDQGQLDLF